MASVSCGAQGFRSGLGSSGLGLDLGLGFELGLGLDFGLEFDLGLL